jgi:hypothetical protein
MANWEKMEKHFLVPMQEMEVEVLQIFNCPAFFCICKVFIMSEKTYGIPICQERLFPFLSLTLILVQLRIEI